LKNPAHTGVLDTQPPNGADSSPHDGGVGRREFLRKNGPSSPGPLLPRGKEREDPKALCGGGSKMRSAADQRHCFSAMRSMLKSRKRLAPPRPARGPLPGQAGVLQAVGQPARRCRLADETAARGFDHSGRRQCLGCTTHTRARLG